MRSDDVSVRTQLKQAAILVLVVGVVVGAVVGYAKLTPSGNANLFSLLHGPTTQGGDLIIDTADGTFAGLRLGMPFAAAVQRLPRSERCSSEPTEITYCDGNGLLVTIASACDLISPDSTIACPTSTDVGPLAAIEIEATTGEILAPGEGSVIRAVPGSQRVVTERGLRLGDSSRTLRRDYVITSTIDFPDSACDGEGDSYVTTGGDNTTVFTIEGDAVEMITLYPGRWPDLCT